MPQDVRFFLGVAASPDRDLVCSGRTARLHAGEQSTAHGGDPIKGRDSIIAPARVCRLLSFAPLKEGDGVRTTTRWCVLHT